jgi:hypothetical protein
MSVLRQVASVELRVVDVVASLGRARWPTTPVAVLRACGHARIFVATEAGEHASKTAPCHSTNSHLAQTP